MRDIDDYIEQAKLVLNVNSDGKLGRKLDINASSICQWRTRRAWPNDESMCKLANGGNMDAEQALLDLCVWRTANKSPLASKVWSGLSKKLTVPLTLVLAIIISTDALSTEANITQIPASVLPEIYVIGLSVPHLCR